MKSAYDTNLYPPSCIYNMDETFFSVGSSRKTRKIGPNTLPTKAVTSPASNQHITVLACIGIEDAPIPPVILYQGATVQKSWTAVMEADVPQLAEVTESGWVNGVMMKKWLEAVFDPYTRDRVPRGKRRLLILDGHDTHVKVDFLEACWSRNISCLILPSNMTNIFQPLDVAFFNQLKRSYHSKCEEHLLHTSSTTLSKGLFWRWHQQAWKETAVGRFIRPGWKKSGLWPLDAEMMGVKEDLPCTPPPDPIKIEPPTPRTIHIGRRNVRAVRRGEMNAEEALLKSQKALEGAYAKITLLEKEIESRDRADGLDKAARGKKGKATFPRGVFFDPIYQMEHAEELADRAARENERSTARKRRKGAVSYPDPSNFVLGQAGPSSYDVPNHI